MINAYLEWYKADDDDFFRKSFDKCRIECYSKFVMITKLLDKHLNKLKEAFHMKKYICEACQYVYDPVLGDPDGGIAPGTAFEDIPEDWVCPLCGVGKDMFVVME